MVSLHVEDWLLCGCSQPTVEQELMCDYSKKITPLYWAIQSHQWASVNKFLKTGYWKDSFFRDPVRPEIQAKTWMVRYDEVGATTATGENEHESTSKQKIICWKQLPMHAAIVYSAPAIIIQKLLHMYPTALRCSDNRGNLPIHLAFRHGSNDAVLALILQEYPEGMNAREANGLLPTECATELPSPQPLRGALLRTAMSKEDDKTRSSKVQSHLKSERFFFDDRPVTPHQGNLSTKSSMNTNKERAKSPFDPKYHLSVLTQQVENLRSTVESALTTPAHSTYSEAKSDLPVHLQTASQTQQYHQARDPSSQQQQQQPESTTPRQDPSASNAKSPSPTRKAATPLSPTTLATLQDLVTRALIGSSSGTPPSETNHRSSSQDLTNDPPSESRMAGPIQSPSLPPLPPASTRHSQLPVTTPTNMELQQHQQTQPSPHHAQQNNEMHHLNNMSRLPTAPDPQEGADYRPIRSPSPFRDILMQHQQQQQQLQQLHENRQQLDVRPTDTFEEQQRQLDNEVSRMEERMANMEQVMKEMYKREKTVRRELALTLKEVKHWKAQAKRAATEEEKNRILTEMLHEFVPAATTTPRHQNKTPTARGEKRSDNRFPSNRDDSEPESQDEEAPRRSKVIMLVDDEETTENFDPVKQRRDPNSHGPRSNRHSDVGVYQERDQHDRVRAGTSSRYNDKPHAIPLRRIQSENYQRRDRERDNTTPLNTSGRRRVDPNEEVRETPRHRGYIDPPTTTGEDKDNWMDGTDDDTDTAEFSLSLVEKVAALQSAKQKKSRNFKYKSALAKHQTRKQREAQAEYAHGGWRSRDPEMHSPRPLSPQSKQAVYHGQNPQWKSTPKTLYSKSTTASSSVSDSDYYPRD